MTIEMILQHGYPKEGRATPNGLQVRTAKDQMLHVTWEQAAHTYMDGRTQSFLYGVDTGGMGINAFTQALKSCPAIATASLGVPGEPSDDIGAALESITLYAHACRECIRF